jgi:starch synthase
LPGAFSKRLKSFNGHLTSFIDIKRLYDDDPVFKRAKVILSLYDGEFGQSLNKAFRKKLRLDGIPEEDLKVVEDPSYINYCKLVVNMSDGIILGSKEIHKDILKYIEKSDKPVLPYQNSETYVEAYSEFYDKVLNG